MCIVGCLIAHRRLGRRGSDERYASLDTSSLIAAHCWSGLFGEERLDHQSDTSIVVRLRHRRCRSAHQWRSVGTATDRPANSNIARSLISSPNTSTCRTEFDSLSAHVADHQIVAVVHRHPLDEPGFLSEPAVGGQGEPEQGVVGRTQGGDGAPREIAAAVQQRAIEVSGDQAGEHDRQSAVPNGPVDELAKVASFRLRLSVDK